GAGDRWNLGVVAGTERQVVEHLSRHLQRLPREDLKSRAIVEQMRDDESEHATVAVDAGAAELPGAIKRLMRVASTVMTRTAHHI
ncbi:MAG: demethoxyubiquinone hydroxylase family protein, partial [Proteobacteria bacterium]